MLTIRALLACVAVPLFAPCIFAQLPNVTNATATPQPGMHDYLVSPIETVNPANGSVSVRIPLRIVEGRQLTVPFSIAYDTTGAFYIGTSTLGGAPIYTTTPTNPTVIGTRGGWSYSYPVLSFYGGTFQIPGSLDRFITCWGSTNYVFQDPNGNRHSLGLSVSANVASPDGYDNCNQGLQGDGEHTTGQEGPITASTSIPPSNIDEFPSVAVSDGDGTVFSFPGGSPGNAGLTQLATLIKDRNGNSVTITSNGTAVSYIDSIGRQALHTSGIGSNPDSITVAGLTSAYKVYWTTTSANFTESMLNLCTGAGCQTCPSSLSATANVVSSIVLPNGTQFSFTYEHTYGMLSKIVYPNGGYVRFVWGLNSQADAGAWSKVVGSGNSQTVYFWDCRYGSPAITDRYVSYDGNIEVLHQHFAYSTNWPNNTSYYWNYKTTTVTTTDLLRNTSFTTSYQYSPVGAPYVPNCGSCSFAAQLPVEQTIQYGDVGGATIRTVNKSWKNVRLLQTQQTILDAQHSSLTVSCYDVNEQLIERDEYDFGAGVPTGSCASVPTGTVSGPLARKTTTAYATFSQHIVDRPSTNIIYDGGGNRIAETDYPSYDPNGNLLIQTTQCLAGGGTCSQGSSTTTYTYDSHGQVLTMTDPRNGQTTYSYTDNYASCGGAAPASSPSDAYLTAIAYPQTGSINHIVNMCYDYANGLLLSSTDENSRVTTYAYADALDRLTQVSHPDGGITTYSYNDALSSPSVTISAKINSVQTMTVASVMDGLAHPVQTQLTSDPQGIVYTNTTYDALGRRYKVYNPTRCSTPTTNCGESTWGYTTYTYDALGRVTSVTAQDGSVTTTSYSGNCATTTDPAGKARKSCTDALGRLTQVFEDPSGLNYETDYTYDALDNLISVTQKGGITDSSKWRVRTFTYDSLSRLISATNPESGTVTYAYDANGNLISKTAPAPNQTGSATVTTTYTYDALNRLTSKSFSDGVTPSFYFTYDISSQYGFTFQNPIGRMVLAERPCSSIFFSYDSMGRVINNEQASFLSCTGGAASPVPTYQYDLAGNMTTYVNGAGVWFTQTYDSAGRPTALTSSYADAQHPGTLATVDPTHGYFPNGTLHTWKTGNGLTQTAALNSRLQPCRINVNYGNVSLNACTDPVPSTNVQDLAYGFNSGANNGNIASWSGSPWLNFNRSYTYDSLNRLSAMSSPSDPGGCTGLSWTYDAWGNRTDQTTTGGSCGQFHASVNAKNQLLDPVNNSYQYDAAGNVIFDGSHHYLYDAENRLIQVDPHSGYCSSQGNTSTAAACYVYDALGRRVAKIPASGVWTQYAYDLSGNVISEYGEGCGPTCWARGYVYFNGQRIAEYANSTTYFAHNDHLGSPRLFTDVTAYYATDCYDFLPFGERNLPTSPCSSPSPPAPPPE